MDRWGLILLIKGLLLPVLSVLIFITSVYGKDVGLITKDNWVNHPKIKEIREIYNEVEAEIKNKTVIEQRKTFGYARPYGPTLKVVYFDKFKTVRKYVEFGGFVVKV